jgi:ankyrin repeat domain-containing protein 50
MTPPPHNNINNYLLLEASKINNKELLNESIKNKGDINYIDQYNRNAMHYAAINNSNNIIKVLLKHKQLNKKDSFNKYPIDYAKENKNQTMIKLLSRAFKTYTIKRK